MEIAVDSVQGLNACVTGGADRIELGASLFVGGLTPSRGLMEAAAELSIEANVLIRPRAGDFCFGSDEVAVMIRDIRSARDAGLTGVVLGAALPNGELDRSVLAHLRDAAGDLICTLHRVIDVTPDIYTASETAIELGFDRVLTSGGTPRAIDGLETLKRLDELVNGRIKITAGSGLDVKTIKAIAMSTRIRSFHASCQFPVQGDSMLTAFGFDLAEPKMTDPLRIRDLKRAIDAVD